MMSTFKQMMKNSVIIGICLMLSACAVSKEHFDCPHAKGVGCHSISEVNQMVDRGTLTQKNPHQTYNQVSVNAEVPQTAVPVSSEQMRLDFLAVNRVSEAPLKIWFAPFQDEQGNFHEASVIHTVLKPGFWQVEDL